VNTGSDSSWFAEIADERRTLAGTLATLTPEQWEAQSLCDAWTVRDVAAHLVMPLVTPLWTFGLAMVRSRGDFDSANVRLTRRTCLRHGHRLPEMLVEHAAGTFTPPGHGPLAPLTDVLVHGEDIRRPLHIDYAIPEQRQRAVLDFLVSSSSASMFSAQTENLRWQATDLDWGHGTGPIVEGPAAALMLVLTGRRVALTDTTGAGAELLAERKSR
jgi:uncharacterized protein (TIGR03083 family)